MWLQSLLCLFIFCIASAIRELPYITSHKDANGDVVYEMTLSSPIVKVYEADQYFCFTKFLEELGEVYIVSGFVEYDHNYIHHAATGFCDEPADFAKQGPWECSSNRDKSCPGSAVSGIGFDDFSVNKKNALKFPKDVSIRVGSMARLRYFTYELHFKTPVTDTPYPLVNITLSFVKSPTKYFFQSSMLLTSGYIPANTEKGYFTEIACPWTKPEVVAFGVNLHTHHKGLMAEAYRIRNGTWTLLASRLTQGKTAKEIAPIIGGFVDIKPGDILAAKCLYINKGDRAIKFGLTDDEEMCNAAIAYGYEFKDENHFTRSGGCATNIPEFSFCDHEQTAAICGKDITNWN